MIFQLRIGDKTHYDLEYVKALTEEIVKHGKPYDEVWLATSYALPSLDKCREGSGKNFCRQRNLTITPGQPYSRSCRCKNGYGGHRR